MIDVRTAIYSAVTAVAANCDGAQSDDAIGFNGQDTKFGRNVAVLALDEWDDVILDEAAVMITKYLDTQVLPDAATAKAIRAFATEARKRRQYITNRFGDQRPAGREKAAELIREKEAAASRRVEVADGELTFYFDYDRDLIAALKSSVPRRRWNGAAKVWTAPVSAEAIEFAKAHGFAVPAIDVPAPAPVEEKVHATLDGTTVTIDAPYDPALVAAMRGVTGRRWDAAKKVNTFPASAEVATLIAAHGLTATDEVHAACGAPVAAPATGLADLSDATALPEGVALEDEGIEGLYGFQKVAVHYAQQANNRVLIGDQMGLGKTREAIAIIEAWKRSKA